MSTIIDAAPSRDEANEMLVNEFGWSRNCILIRDFDFEWGQFKRDWTLGGKTLAVQNFTRMRDGMARAEQAAFHAKTSAFSSSGAAAYADNWN